MRYLRLLLALTFCLFIGMETVHAAPTHRGTVHVKITYVEMNRHDVRRLSVIAPPLNRRHQDLLALERAARRAHVRYTVTHGPVLTAHTGKPTSRGGVTVTPLSVRAHRAYVRIRQAQVILHNRHSVSRIVVASHLYHSGETRRLAGQAVKNRRYRYVFATVTVP